MAFVKKNLPKRPSQGPRMVKVSPGEMGHGDRPRPSNFMRNINVMHGNQQVFNKKVNPGGGDCGCG
mgnify:FL=1